jgi:ADP-ribosyl-[dinitrogen reductase] hydrolase
VLRRRKEQASEATSVESLTPVDLPGDDLVVLQDGHGLLLTGPDELVAGMVARLRSIEVHAESDAPAHRASGLSQLASLAGLVPKPGSRSAEYVRLTPRSRALLEQHGAIPGGNGTFKGYVRGAEGQFAGILDWTPAKFDPAQMMTLQSAAVGLALQTAIAQVQESIERVEDKIDRLTDLVSSEHVGKVLGQHRVLVPLVERATTDQTLSVTDWSTVAALGPEVSQTIEALRSYVSKRLDRVHRKRTPTGKAEELRDLLDDGMLREAMAMLVIAEDNLRLWQQLRIVNVRLREREHLGATIESARRSLEADIEADQALVSAMGVVVGELMETRPLHGFDVVGVRRLDQAGSEVLDLMHAFAENRLLEVEPLEEYQRPGVGAAFGHLGSKILRAAKAAPSAVPFVRSGAVALPAGDDLVLDRSVAALLGVHVGDSLGATLEFVDPERARQLFPDGHREIIGGGTFGWEAGAPTDDTDLTLAVAEAYRLGGDTDSIVMAAAEQMLRWYEGGPKDVGGTTASALQRFRRDRDPSTSGRTDEGSQGNGSLMRTMPVAIARANDELRAAEAEAISAVTHAHPVCTVACVAYCDLANALIEGEAAPVAVEQVLDPLANGATTAERAVADAILFGVQLREGGDWPEATGWVLDSLALAVWAVLGDESFEDTLVRVVMHGGDADTNGAIAGGLLGAKLGTSAIPERWLQPLHARDQLVELARHLVDVRRQLA